MEERGSGVHIPSSADDFTKKWLRRIERSIKYRKKQKEEWDKNEESVYLEGDPPLHKTGDYVRVNKCGAWLEARVSALTYKRFRFKVKPEKPEGWEPIPIPVMNPTTGPVIDPTTGQPLQEMVTRAQVIEAVLNKLISHPNFGSPATAARVTADGQMSMGVSKVGWTADFEDLDEEVLPIPAEDVPFYPAEEIANSYEHTDAEGGGQVPLIDSSGMLVPKGRRPISEQWYWECVHPKKMLFDPDGEQDFSTHAWCGVEVRRPLADVKADRRLKNTKDLTATVYESETEDEIDWDADLSEKAGHGADDDDTDMVRLFEIWDFNEGRWYIFADGCNEALLDEEFPEGVDPVTGPWVFYRPIERTGKWYPHPPISNGRPVEAWFNEAKSKELRDMQKSARKLLYDTALVNEDDALRLLNGNDEAVGVERDKLTGALSEAVFEFPVGGVNPQTFAHVSSAEYAFDEAMGAPGESRGKSTTNTATQTKAMVAGQQIREDYQRAKLRDHLVDVGRKLLMSVQENMTIDQYIEIAGPDGMVMAMNATPDMLQGEFDVSVDIEEMTPYDSTAQQSSLAQIMQIGAGDLMLLADEEVNDAIFERFHIQDKRLSRGLARLAKTKLQMMMQSERDAEKPPTDAPQDEAEAISQQGVEQ